MFQSQGRRYRYGIIFVLVFPLAVLLLSPLEKHYLVNKSTEKEKAFACAINCMDGRVQDAVKNYIKEAFHVNYVDIVTEPGPNRILAENTNQPIIESIKKRLEISVHHHGTKVVALVGHFGCAGNPANKEDQVAHLRQAKKTIESFGLGVEVILLWVDDGWEKAERVG